jgi:anamorsin
MSNRLHIYLGSCVSDTDTGDDTLVVVSAANLAAAATTAPARSNVWKSLHIMAKASEITAVWSSLSLASLQLDDEAEVTVSISDVASSCTNWTSSIHTAFLLAGLQGTSEKRDSNGNRVITALKKKLTSQPASAKAVALPKRLPTKVSITPEDDIINEDELLNDEGDLAPDMNGVSDPSDENDCGGRSACDNCTCGRADQEALSTRTEPLKSSACGKCGLGDAFRCASCPYLGKPAFKAGEEHLVLDMQDDF